MDQKGELFCAIFHGPWNRIIVYWFFILSQIYFIASCKMPFLETVTIYIFSRYENILITWKIWHNSKRMAQGGEMKTGGLEEAKEYMMEKDIPQLFEVIILYSFPIPYRENFVGSPKILPIEGFSGGTLKMKILLGLPQIL